MVSLIQSRCVLTTCSRPRPSLVSGKQAQTNDQDLVVPVANGTKRKQHSATSSLLPAEGPDATDRVDRADLVSGKAVAARVGGGNIKDGKSAGPVPRSAWLRAQLSSHEWSALVSVANHNGERVTIVQQSLYPFRAFLVQCTERARCDRL